MTVHMPKFNRERPTQRRMQLIEATLRIVSRSGPQKATVRAIAQEANVTQGLIRHHFETKDELLCAAFEHHMTALTADTAKAVEATSSNPFHRLYAFLVAALTKPVINGPAVFLWAGFINMAQTNAKMHAVHAKTYCDLRDLLEGLIGDVFAAQGTDVSPSQLRAKTIACNAVLDGLWLEGGALPEFFDPDQLLDTGLDAIQAILGVTLTVPLPLSHT